jgi:hypothetical protein
MDCLLLDHRTPTRVVDVPTFGYYGILHRNMKSWYHTPQSILCEINTGGTAQQVDPKATQPVSEQPTQHATLAYSLNQDANVIAETLSRLGRLPAQERNSSDLRW